VARATVSIRRVKGLIARLPWPRLRPHGPPIVQHPDEKEGAVCTSPARHRQDVRLRPDDVRLQPPRPRPVVHRFRHGAPVSRVSGPSRHVRPELHGHRGGHHPTGEEAGQAPLAYAQYYIDSFLDDMRALNVRRPDHMPKVSEHIPEITAL